MSPTVLIAMCGNTAPRHRETRCLLPAGHPGMHHNPRRSPWPNPGSAVTLVLRADRVPVK